MGDVTGAAWALVGVAAVLAVVDWWAVGSGSRRLELVAKPAVMVALVAAALAIDPVDGGQRAWFVAALVLSLAGDVFLVLDERPLGPIDTFTAGLASFLLGHLAYIAGFAARGFDAGPAVVLVVLPLAVAPRIVGGARRHGMAVPVGAYVAVIAAMLGAALASGVWPAAAGAGLFVASDAMIGWSRFVRPFRGHRLAIITTYHVAQALLVLSVAS